MEKFYTSDGVEITPGLRVMTIDVKWGTVEPEQFTRERSTDPGGEYFDGWFDVLYEDGTKTLMNGERMRTTEIPRVLS